MKIFTNYKIEMDKTLVFWGEDDETALCVGDVVYLWQDRNRSGLGDEIIYGSAIVTKVLDKNYVEAKRIA